MSDLAPSGGARSAAGSIRHWARRAGRAGAVLGRDIAANGLTGLLVILSLVFWRLGQGPMSLDPLIGEVEAALSDPARRVTVGAAELEWQPGLRPLGLTVRRVGLADADGRPLAEFAELLVRLDVPALLEGQVRPRSLSLVGPELRVDRAADGAVALRLPPVAAEGPAAPGDTDLAALGARLMAEGVLERLERIEILDGRVTVDDRLIGRVWQASGVTLALAATADGVAGRLEAAADLAGGTLTLGGDGTLDLAAGTGQVDLSLGGAGVSARDLAALDPVLAGLAAVDTRLDFDLVLDGAVDLGAAVPLQPRAVGFDILTGPATIDTGDLYPEPFLLASGRLRGAVDLGNRRVRFDNIGLDLGGPTVEASGRIDPLGGGAAYRLALDGRLEGLPVEMLDRLWPPAAQPGGHAWVTANLSQAMIRDGSFEFAARLPGEAGLDGALNGMDVETLNALVSFEGMRVTYLDGMPAITGIDGEATISLEAVEITTRGGSTVGLSVPESVIRIDGFDLPDAWIDIDAVVTGGLADVLALIDRPRLGFAGAMGLDPAAASGAAGVRLRFRFPLIDALPQERVAIAAAANLSGAGLGTLGEDLDISAIDGRLSLTGRGFAVTGQGSVNGVPLDFTWEEAFAGGESPSSLELSGVLDDDARARLGLDGGRPALTGPIAVAARLTGRHDGAQTVSLAVDLTGAGFTIPEIDYVKLRGEAGTLSADIELYGGRPSTVRRLALDLPRLAAEGTVAFAEDGSVSLVDLPEIAFDDHRFAARLSWLEDATLAVELRGAFIDAEPLIADWLAGADAPEEEQAPDALDTLSAAAAAVTATLSFDRVRVTEEGDIENVTGLVVFDGDGGHRIDVAGSTARGGRLHVNSARAGGQLAIRGQVVGLGTVLGDLALSEEIEGGLLSLTLASVPPTDAAAAPPPLAGTIRAERFRVRDAPVLARLIAALSITGLQTLMYADGLVFERAELQLALAGDTLTLSDGRAYGGALGLRLDGEVDLAGDTVSAYGTIVPLYGVNGFLAGIPLIGDILTGSSGGIFAFTYAIDGPLAGPSVSVNPLSVLAPGFLRDLFFLGESDEIAESTELAPEWPGDDQ